MQASSRSTTRCGANMIRMQPDKGAPQCAFCLSSVVLTADWCTMQVIPGVAIGYCTYEFMRKTLGVQTNPGSER